LALKRLPIGILDMGGTDGLTVDILKFGRLVEGRDVTSISPKGNT
jgi:hypothetical protein